MSTQTVSVLRTYRELLTLIRKLPQTQRDQALVEAKSAVRAHQHETDAAKVSDLLKQMAAKISYLRVITPRTPGERASHIGAGHYVMRDGHLVEGEGRSSSRCGSGGDLNVVLRSVAARADRFPLSVQSC